MIARNIEGTLKAHTSWFPVVCVTGPRQSGKTTVTQLVFPQAPYANLEQASTLELLEADPLGFLNGLLSKGTPVIIDEAQRCPQLFSWLQVISDDRGRNGLFLITGSQQFLLSDRIAQSLAGRISVLVLLPLSLRERPGSNQSLETVLLTGLFPRLYDTRRPAPPPDVLYENYVSTYLERDVRQLSAVQDLTAFHRFLRLCAARIGQLLNKANLAVEASLSQPTVERWLSVLEASNVITRLEPFHANISKRLVKTPKLYFCDTGLAAHLAGIRDAATLETHPLRGHLFENLVFLEIRKQSLNQGRTPILSFFRDKTGHEVDFISETGERIRPIEVKCSQTFRSEYLDGIRWLDRLLGERIEHPLLLYAGQEESRVRDIEVTNAIQYFSRPIAADGDGSLD